MKISRFVLLLVWVCLCSCRAEPKSEIVVEQAHMTVMPPGSHVAAVYMLLSNHSKETKSLLYAHSPIAGAIEVHQTLHEEGLMKMREVQHLKINPGAKMAFEPGGLHLMLFDVELPPKVGERFELVLEFDGGSVLKTDVAVRAIH